MAIVSAIGLKDLMTKRVDLLWAALSVSTLFANSYILTFDSNSVKFVLQPFGMNDVMGCYLDLQRGEIKWSKNGISDEIICFSVCIVQI